MTRTADSVPQRHPVADLLTPEMKARVCAARFYRDDDPDREFCATVAAEIDGVICCPMGVVLGSRRDDRDGHPIADTVAEALAIDDGEQVDRAIAAIEDFIERVDLDQIKDPADIYILLGCDALSAARPPEAGTPGERP